MKFKLRCFLSLLILVCCIHPTFSQKKIEKAKKEILGEGLALYTLILANWTSNDLYYENEYNINYVKGYLSYREKDTIKTIFWREIDTSSAEYKAKTFQKAGDTGIVAQQQPPKINDVRVIVKTMRYARMSVTKKNAAIADEEREPNEKEKILMDFRAMTYKSVSTDTSFFKRYAGTQMRAIPFDAGKEVKVYVYVSTTKEGVVPIGGDYLLLFDKKEKTLISKMDLHDDCVFIATQYKGKSYDASKATVHSHKDGAAELITPTDIATLLLYKSQLEWDEHHVIAGEYTCVFTLIDRKLDIIPTAEFEYLKKKKSDAEKEELKGKMH